MFSFAAVFDATPESLPFTVPNQHPTGHQRVADASDKRVVVILPLAAFQVDGETNPPWSRGLHHAAQFSVGGNELVALLAEFDAPAERAPHQLVLRRGAIVWDGEALNHCSTPENNGLASRLILLAMSTYSGLSSAPTKSKP